MHLGHARTSLLTWLRARSHVDEAGARGRIVMRIEDLDPPRVRPGSAESILRDHERLGLDWDEGPFYQSARDHVYEAALERLRAAGRVFPCTCTRREIEATWSSAPHTDDPFPRIYPGTCWEGVSHPDRDPATRFRVSAADAGYCDLEDQLAPNTRCELGGDFVVRRSDGLWAYQLAVVVDDAEMGITEVIRARDLLSSTPRQLALYAALGRPAPAFLHVGMVLGRDGERLSKRNGAAPIAEHLARQSVPELLGWLAHSLGQLEQPRAVDLPELLERFELAKVPVGDVLTQFTDG